MSTVQIIPSNEDERLAAVRRYDILDTPPDGTFDRIAATAADLFDVPIGIVSIVDTDRIWFKSHYGLDGVTEIGRDPGLCASAILGAEPWVVTDAVVDARTLANPLVAGDFGLRFYAGVPLTTSDGFNLGTLCVLDTKPREVTDSETEILSNLATVVVDQLELRLSARRALELSESRLVQAQRLAEALQSSLLPPALPEIEHVELAAAYQPANRFQVGGDFYDVFPIDASTWGLTIGDVCGKGPVAAGRTSCARYSLRAGAIHETEPSKVLELANQALLVDADPATDPPFVTALFARVQATASGATVHFASGGHPLPVVIRADGSVGHAGSPGSLLGVFPTARTTDSVVELGPGDSLVLMTDGVPDSGTPRLEKEGVEALLRSAPARSAEEVVDRIRQAVSAEQTDDVAVLVLRVVG